MIKEDIFPTEFARRLGESCGLMERHKKNMDVKKYARRNEMMQSFQQMALSCSFDDCLVAFYGVKLSKEDLDVLTIVHKSTVPWTMGNAAKVLLEKLNSSLVNGKDARELALAIQELAGKKSDDNNGLPKGSLRFFEARID